MSMLLSERCKKVNCKSLTVILVFMAILIVSPVLGAGVLKKASIKWEPIKGAEKYQVEVADENEKVVYNKVVDEPAFEVRLLPGEYKYRIGIITKFDKLYKWSDWFNLTIIPPLQPVVLSFTPQQINVNKKSVKVVITGEKFHERSKVIIENSLEYLKIKKFNFVNSNKIIVEVGTEGITPGNFKIIVKNPGDLISISSQELYVTRKETIAGIFHHFGLEGGYYTPPAGQKSVYTGFGGIKLFYEFHEMWRFKQLSYMKKAPGFFPGIEFSFL